MSDWKCPDCGGGFTSKQLEEQAAKRPCCPWCSRRVEYYSEEG